MKLWNKRKLSQKYYRGSEEIQSPQLSQNTVNFNVFDEPDEFSHLTAIKRPKSKRLSVENGGFLDSPFSTFGKTPPKMQHQDSFDKENCTPVRPVSSFASPTVRTIKTSHVSPILELSEYQIPLNSVRVPSLSSNEDVSCTASGRLIPPYSVMPLPWVTDSDTSSVKSEITDEEDHSKMAAPVTSVVYALPRKTQTKKTVVQVKKSSRPPPVPPKPRSGLVNYCSSVDSNSGYSVIYPRSAPDSVSIESDQSGDSVFKHGPMIDYHSNRSSMSDPGHRNVYASLDSISMNSVESDPGYRFIAPATDASSVKSCSVIESDEDLPLPPPPEIPSVLDYTESDLPPPPPPPPGSSSPDIFKCQEFPSVPIQMIDSSLPDQVTGLMNDDMKDNVGERGNTTRLGDAEGHTTTVGHTTDIQSVASPQKARLGWCHALTAKPYSAPSRSVSKVVLLQGIDRDPCNDMQGSQLGLSKLSDMTERTNSDDVYANLNFLKKGEYTATCNRVTTGKCEMNDNNHKEKINKIAIQDTPATEDAEPSDGVVSPGYMEMDSIKNTLTGRVTSKCDTHCAANDSTSERVVSPGYMEMDSIKNTITGGVASKRDTHCTTNIDTSERVVSLGYMEMDSIKNTLTGRVTSKRDTHCTANDSTSDRVVSPGYMEMASIKNTITGGLASQQDIYGQTDTDTDDKVLSPGYVELEKIQTSDISRNAASNLPMYAVHEEVLPTSPLPKAWHGTMTNPSDYTILEVRDQGMKGSPGCGGNMYREPDVDISPNVTTRRGRRRKTLKQDTISAMDSCPTLEELNLSRDTGSDGKSKPDNPITQTEPPISQTEPPITQTEPPITQTEPPITQTEPPITQTEPPITQTEPPITQTEPPITQTEPPITQTEPPITQTEPPITQTEPPITQTEPPITQTEPPITQTEPPITQTEPPITQTEDQALKAQIQMFTHLNNGDHSDKSDCLSETHFIGFDMEQRRSNSINEDVFHPAPHLNVKPGIQRNGDYCQLYSKQDSEVSKSSSSVKQQNCTEQSQGSLSTDQEPSRSLNTNQQFSRSSSTQQPPRSFSTDQQPPRSFSTDQQPPRSLSKDQQPPRSLSKDQHPQSSSRIDQTTFHPIGNLSVEKGVFLENNVAEPSSCVISTSVSSVCVQSNVKIQHNSNPQSKLGHVRNPSISRPKWLSNDGHGTRNPDPPSNGGHRRNLPAPSNTPHSLRLPVKSESSILSAPHLQVTAPYSLTMLTQSPRKLQNFRDRIPAKFPAKNKGYPDIQSHPLLQIQCAPNQTIKPNSQTVNRENDVKHGVEVLKVQCAPTPALKTTSQQTLDRGTDVTSQQTLDRGTDVTSQQTLDRGTDVKHETEILETDIDSITGNDSHELGKPKLQRAQSSETIIW
ncbi:uncharacterized protein LOC117328248 isoform X2 [Pecten maximus]|nr:uncharacterized protein LOC117328248 isoform X2 [Pecten maximus]